jgi:hypothetical protein
MKILAFELVERRPRRTYTLVATAHTEQSRITARANECAGMGAEQCGVLPENARSQSTNLDQVRALHASKLD